MKKAYFLAVLLGVAAWVDADAQVTQRFPNVVAFGTNAFLHDAPTVPLHERVPTGTVVVALTSTNGSVTINDLGDGTYDLTAADSVDLSSWSSYAATQKVNVGTGTIYGVTGSHPLSEVGGSSMNDIRLFGGNFGGLAMTNAKGNTVRATLTGNLDVFGDSSDIRVDVPSYGMGSGKAEIGGDRSIVRGYVRGRLFNSGDQSLILVDQQQGPGTFVSNTASAAVMIGYLATQADDMLNTGRGAVMIGPGTNTADNSLTVSGRVKTGDYFEGPGSGLSNVPGSAITNAPWLLPEVGNANYWRRTTAVPTNSAFAGTDGQRTLVWLSSTHAVERVYSGVSNLWLQSGTFYTFP